MVYLSLENQLIDVIGGRCFAVVGDMKSGWSGRFCFAGALINSSD